MFEISCIKNSYCFGIEEEAIACSRVQSRNSSAANAQAVLARFWELKSLIGLRAAADIASSRVLSQKTNLEYDHAVLVRFWGVK